MIILLSVAALCSTFAALVLLIITRITVVFSFVGAIASTMRRNSTVTVLVDVMGERRV